MECHNVYDMYILSTIFCGECMSTLTGGMAMLAQSHFCPRVKSSRVLMRSIVCCKCFLPLKASLPDFQQTYMFYFVLSLEVPCAIKPLFLIGKKFEILDICA